MLARTITPVVPGGCTAPCFERRGYAMVFPARGPANIMTTTDPIGEHVYRPNANFE